MKRPSDQRQIRVFLSSTFKDMHAERELLIKRVFPELRRICSQRFVSFTEVDLRWGITEEQAAEGKVLPICLEEIHRCRPYFVGLLGERYGWIPDRVPQTVIEKEPWLKEHVAGRSSVTELEILHGVLNNPEMDGHAFFYFRDPAYVDTVPENDRVDFISENARSAEKLGKLKARIRQSGLAVVQDYSVPESLATAVRQRFMELIDRLYPEEDVPDPLDQEAMGHQVYAMGKLSGYVERPAHTAVLDVFVKAQSTGQGLVITGDSGGGKTALLAAWAEKLSASHPNDFLFQHYFGATPESAAATGFLRRLFGELKRCYDISDEIPTEPDKMREALPLWLAQTEGRGRVILILDGLNQIEGDEADRYLGFMPRYFPAHIRVAASALPGPAFNALKARGWIVHDLPTPDKAERTRMINAFLDLYRKTLQPDLITRLIDAPGAANPLFLRTVLEELRQFGRFEQLTALLTHYLAARSPDELFRRVLRRWQEDFDNGRDLVRRACRHLWAARQGLSETEWLELLGTDAQALPRQVWTPLFLAMEPHLANRNGLYAFGHDFLRQATRGEFLPSDKEERTAHLALADYFEHPDEMTPRKASEWPWQLHAAGSWDRLESCLTDKDLFLALNNGIAKWDLTGYWLPLRTRGVDLGESYTGALDRWREMYSSLDEDYSLSHAIGQFLHDNGCYIDAEPLYRHALEGREGMLGKTHPDTLVSVSNLAALLESKGDYDAAEPLCRRALEGKEDVLGKTHPDTLVSVSNLAGLLKSKGDYDEAEPLCRRALEGKEDVLGKTHPDTLVSVSNLAGLLESKGDYDAAELLCRRALKGREDVLGKTHPDTLVSVNNLAVLLEIKGDYAQAEPLYRRALEGFEGVLGKIHPDTLTSVSNLAGLLKIKGDYDAAEPLYRRALEGREDVLGKTHPGTLVSVNDLAGLLENKGDYAQAEPLYRRALEGFEGVLGKTHPDTLTSVNNVALLLYRKGDYSQAELLCRRALEGREGVLGKIHPDTLMSVCNLAGLLKGKGDYAQAEPLYRRALEGFEGVLGKAHPDTLMSVSNLAGLLEGKGDYAQAEPLYRRALEGFEGVLGKNHSYTLTSVNNLAVLLESKGDYDDAESLYRRVFKGFEGVLGKTHPDTLTSVNNLARLLESKGDYAQAEPLFRRALDGTERVLGSQSPEFAIKLNNHALFLRKINRSEEAETLLRRALAIEENCLPPDSPKIPHRLNNLTTVLVMRGKLDEAMALNSRALRLKYGNHDITSARILFMRVVINLLLGKAIADAIGQMKGLLSEKSLDLAGKGTSIWDIGPVLDYVKPRVAGPTFALLEGMVAVMNNKSQAEDLEKFSDWRDPAAIMP